MESPFKNTLERLRSDPRERVAKALRRAAQCANEVAEYVPPPDLWEDESATPEWLRDDYRAMADAAMAELRELGWIPQDRSRGGCGRPGCSDARECLMCDPR